MPGPGRQWGPTDAATNSVSWGAASINEGSGNAAQAANNTALYNNVTPGAFKSNMVIGQFGASRAEMANTTGEGKKVHAPGWHLRRAWSGPVKTITVSGSGGGSKFANGETILLSNGSVNGIAICTSNSNQNLVSVAVSSNGGVFVNSSVVKIDFLREKHMNNIMVTGGTGYHNSNYIVVSNAIVNATANISTDGAGTFINSGITLTNVGLFANNEANTAVVFAIKAANGAASNGSGATLTANLTTSSGGTVTVGSMGGRAGRVQYECLVTMQAISNGDTDDTYLPE